MTVAVAHPMASGGFQSLVPLDALAVTLIVAGVAAYLLRRLLPAGLGVSILIAATSVGAALANHHHGWLTAELSRGQAVPIPPYSPHLTAGLAVLWALFAWAASRRSDAETDASGATGPRDTSTFLAWSMVLGIATAVVLIYALVFAAWGRVTAHDGRFPVLRAAGLSDLAALGLAAGLARFARKRSEQPTILLAVGLAGAAWAGLSEWTAPTAGLESRPIIWHWTLWIEVGLAAVLAGATYLRESFYRRRRAAAWPDRLDDLLAQYPRWPGYHPLYCIGAGGVLTLGVYQIVRPDAALGWVGLIGVVSLGAVALAVYFTTYRQWSPTLAELAMGLTTAAIVRLAAAVCAVGFSGATAVEYVERMPVVFNAVLFALAIAAALWYWFTRFWDQQLLDGAAWTTTGRMIPHARRVGFIVLALAVLTAFQMALWPLRVPSESGDAGIGRMIAGVLGILLVAQAGAAQARRVDSPTAATLAVAALVAAATHVIFRAPPSVARGWLFQYDMIALALVCLPILAAAEAAPKTRWRSFAMPLWFLALLILPARALLDLALTHRLPADWVRPMTLAILGGVFALAGTREGRRVFQVLGGVLLVAALVALYHTFGRGII